MPKGGGRSSTPQETPSTDRLAPAEVWPKIKELAGLRLRPMLDAMVLQEATERLLTLAVPEPRAAMVRDHMPEIVRLAQRAGAGSMSISIVEIKPVPSGVNNDHTEAASPAIPHDAADHPLVKEAERVFGAKVVHIEPKR